ncbi:MAG: HlyD family efflux transporter periplasmic adaptor subunit [Alistipes sp.]|jgi:HlyD family secretion protein|nr:HlyD family efflux transporter periplasmic adaptor subunit [Alistipes sp.]
MIMKRYLILATALGLAACGGGKNNYDASGVFEATEVTVSAQGSGPIVWLDLQEGQALTAGTPVGLVDTAQLHLRRDQLYASLGAASARRVDVGLHLSVLENQLATAHREQARFQALVRDNAATQKQLDDIRSSIATLERQIAAQTETLTHGNASLDGETRAMIAGIAQIDDQITRNIISSPIDGTVIAKYAEAGELAAPGRALFKVADLTRIFLRVYITADQLTSLRPGSAVSVFADWGERDRREYSGTVTWISDRAEFTPKTIQTRDERANLVYAVKVAVENDGFIKVGMYGDIKILF